MFLGLMFGKNYLAQLTLAAKLWFNRERTRHRAGSIRLRRCEHRYPPIKPYLAVFYDRARGHFCLDGPILFLFVIEVEKKLY